MYVLIFVHRYCFISFVSGSNYYVLVETVEFISISLRWTCLLMLALVFSWKLKFCLHFSLWLFPFLCLLWVYLCSLLCLLWHVLERMFFCWLVMQIFLLKRVSTCILLGIRHSFCWRTNLRCSLFLSSQISLTFLFCFSFSSM